MTPIVCTVNPSRTITPRLTPTLPAGLTYSIQNGSGNQRTVTISGTPKEGLNPRLFYVGFNAWVSAIEIGSKCLDVSTSFQFSAPLLTVATVSIP